MMHTKILASQDIGTIVKSIGINALLDALVEQLEGAFKSLDTQKANIPPRSGIHCQNPDLGLLEWMPASINQGRASLKIVGYHPTNPSKRKLPTILSSIGLFDTLSGHMECLLDGTFATALRTGAMSAIASKHMFSSDEPITLGIIGCGAQSVTQTHALSRIFKIKRILAYDTVPTASQSLGKRVSFSNVQVTPVSESELHTLLTTSDILCTCTSADPGSGPLFSDFENKPTLHINAVGSDFPTKIELPLPLLRRAFVCPDFKQQAKAEGECQQLGDHEIHTELTELLNTSELQSQSKNSLSVFDSTGHAYADYVTGSLILDYAKEMNLGTDIEVEHSARPT